MSLTFCNATAGRQLGCAYMFYSPNDCGGEGRDFQMLGWFNLDPGQCGTVYENSLNDVDDRLWFAYALDPNDGTEWRGPYWDSVPVAAFDQCYGIGVSAGDETVEVKFFQFDKGDADDWTVRFVD